MKATIKNMRVNNYKGMDKVEGVGISGKYNRDFINEFKAQVPGCIWLPKNYIWWAPIAQADKAIEIAKKHYQVEE